MRTPLEREMALIMQKAMYVVAMNFPETAEQGLTKERLQGYYDFFDSMQHVLPTDDLRKQWIAATKIKQSPTYFSVVRMRSLVKLNGNNTTATNDGHIRLMKWLFMVHDSIKKKLLPSMKPAEGYTTRYKKYEKYRRARLRLDGNNHNEKELDEEGVARIRKLLPSRIRAMDIFLANRFGDVKVAQWSQKQKEEMRKTYLTEAAQWFWVVLYQEALRTNPTFNGLSEDNRRKKILKEFDFESRGRLLRLRDKVSGIPGRFLNVLRG